MKVFIGIDPGAKGSLAVVTEESGGPFVELVPWADDLTPYIMAIRRYTLALRPEGGTDRQMFCALEHVGAMPGQGVTSMFNFGRNFGMLIGMLTTLKVPFELVRPQRWQKEFGISGEKNDHITVCKRLFPYVSLLRTPRCRKDDDGHADALLLAEWSRRHHGQP